LANRLRRRYTIIDHENGGMIDVANLIVLNPARNPADLAAFYTLIENVTPEFAQDLREQAGMIEGVQDRTLSSYGTECLPHITHPKVADFAKPDLTGEQPK
jgi:hypothetical protein